MPADTDGSHKIDLTHSTMSQATPHDEVASTTPQDGGTGVPTRRSRLRWWAVGFVALLAVLAGIVAATLIVSNGTEEPTTEALNTATVQRTDVVATESLAGALGFEPADPVTHRTSSEGITTVRGFASGVVTSVVSEGEFLESGDVLYGINTVPVVVLEGELPVYRTFNSRMSDGADVEQLEQALFDLGFDPDENMTINEDFTSATADTIERLQESLGTEETGSLELGYVVFTPEVVYVSEVFVAVDAWLFHLSLS